MTWWRTLRSRRLSHQPMSVIPAAILIQDLHHAYGKHVALDGANLQIHPGEIFGILGPNGSGKSTLFRVLSTIVPPQRGQVRIFGTALGGSEPEIRGQLGVVFQFPALDKVLTVAENLWHQGHLYRLRGTDLKERISRNLAAVGMLEAAHRRVADLSGGQRRRVELAKAMLHDPKLLILDEPSTGLDPAARIEFFGILRDLASRGTTVALTTHLLDEAERCSRLAILDRGRVIACDTPDALRRGVGRDALTIECDDAESVAARLRQRLAVSATAEPGIVRVDAERPAELIVPILELLGEQARGVAIHRPTLQDVYLHLTGRPFESTTGA